MDGFLDYLFGDVNKKYNPHYNDYLGIDIRNVIKSNKDGTHVFLLCLVLGTFGIHRFYLGKTFSGFLYLVTGGFLGFGVWYDMYTLAINKVMDGGGFNVPIDFKCQTLSSLLCGFVCLGFMYYIITILAIFL